MGCAICDLCHLGRDTTKKKKKSLRLSAPPLLLGEDLAKGKGAGAEWWLVGPEVGRSIIGRDLDHQPRTTRAFAACLHFPLAPTAR